METLLGKNLIQLQEKKSPYLICGLEMLQNNNAMETKVNRAQLFTGGINLVQEKSASKNVFGLMQTEKDDCVTNLLS